ncbi:hypothetical protein B0J17DRAFT_628427 [Rhizoctonia solani]|nr:hypothetical protein B0J17DRAFT_628427 [Rhizoctonia solani]
MGCTSSTPFGRHGNEHSGGAGDGGVGASVGGTGHGGGGHGRGGHGGGGGDEGGGGGNGGGGGGNGGVCSPKSTAIKPIVKLIPLSFLLVSRSTLFNSILELTLNSRQAPIMRSMALTRTRTSTKEYQTTNGDSLTLLVKPWLGTPAALNQFAPAYDHINHDL